MNRAGKWFWAMVAAQVLFLLAWAGYHEVVRQQAPTLLLEGKPVDPRDLLRGDYMILNYDISTVVLAADWKNTGDDVWVLLEKKDRYHVVARASLTPLEPGPGQTLALGRVESVVKNGASNELVRTRVDYGIEKYFVPEGKGTPRFKLMEVEVSVSPAHRLYLKRVLLDGQAFP